MGLHFAEKNDAAIESGNFVKEKLNFRSFINNGIIASVASLVIYFANIPMPDIFYACVGFVEYHNTVIHDHHWSVHGSSILW